MKLNYLAVAFGLSLGVLSAAQPAENEPSPAMTGDAASTALPTSSSPQTPGQPRVSGPAKYGQWRLSVTPYLWFPGVHGNIGAFDRDVSIHASAIDLLSHLRFGLMATANAQWKQLVLPLDVFWVRLADDKALPFPRLAATNADVKAGAFVLTPKVGYRVFDEEKIKFDIMTGFRFWRLRQNLKFSPSILNLDVSRSENWVDPLVGVRFGTPLSGKFEFNLTADVGGWRVGSQLDYQVAGALGYKVKENTTLQAGYRYLAVDYRSGGARAFLFDTALSGIVLGVTFNLK